MDGFLKVAMGSCQSDNSTSDGIIRYKITVKTGDREYAGTDANVRIQITGESSETTAKKLDNSFHSDFEKGQKDEFIVKMKDVKSPLVCKLSMI